MGNIREYTDTVLSGLDLSSDGAVRCAALMADPAVTEEDKSAFLRALAGKGESPVEVAAFAEYFRGCARDPGVTKWADQAIDVCGTGGDHSGSFNVSTAVAFVVAAAGVPVFKHGNRSITSRCGSAQLLEAVGIPLQADDAIWQDSLARHNFAFFFAPAYHPAFKSIMPVRQALAADGVRTVFNLLGPLINPGRPQHQLMGVFSAEWAQPVATALGALGLRRGCVVHSALDTGGALDELSCCGHNTTVGFGEFAAMDATLDPLPTGLSPCAVADLAGGDVADNVRLLDALLAGNAPVGLRDTVALNAGMALWIAGREPGLEEGVGRALELIQSGAVANWLAGLRKFFNG